MKRAARNTRKKTPHTSGEIDIDRHNYEKHQPVVLDLSHYSFLFSYDGRKRNPSLPRKNLKKKTATFEPIALAIDCLEKEKNVNRCE